MSVPWTRHFGMSGASGAKKADSSPTGQKPAGRANAMNLEASVPTNYRQELFDTPAA
jgi:hypothetical protein